MNGTHQGVAALPVLAYREQIITSVRENRVVVITAETGAGKSTQVPRFLAEAGYRVICTQPRRLAASSLAARVAEEMNTRLGDRVGFRTAEERTDSAATEVLFCTDGLQLVRELAGIGAGGRTVLVLDEVHEWNLNVETLIAWARQRVAAGDDLRVVLMSATLDADRLAAFFEGAPVISVPGRLFDVVGQPRAAAGTDGARLTAPTTVPSRDLVAKAVELAQAGRNVLVFLPGKKEIEETCEKLATQLGGRAVVLPLHGQLDRIEQAQCFKPPPAGKVKVVVSTNVAQTSVTIADIDAVVDSGVERRTELVDGIEGLYLKPISQADCCQRAGRAGRVKIGAYMLCSDASWEERLRFPKAEILRSRLDQLVLRLAVQGFDATALKFFHQPDTATLADAKRTLTALGAMSSDGQVTKTGRRMAKMPIDVKYARMLIEAETRGVVTQVATIAACLEAGDVRDRTTAWRSLTQERKSDLLAVLDVYNAGMAMKGGDALRAAGIFAKDFFRAKEVRGKLLDAVRDTVRSDSGKFASKEDERQAILRSCVAGLVDHLYKGGHGYYTNGDRVERQLAKESVVTGGEWLVGLPKDLGIIDKRGRPMTIKLVSMASAVDPTWLIEVAPQLGREEKGLNPSYDPTKDCVVSTTRKFFNGQKVAEVVVSDPEHTEAAEIFARWLADKIYNNY